MNIQKLLQFLNMDTTPSSSAAAEPQIILDRRHWEVGRERVATSHMGIPYGGAEKARKFIFFSFLCYNEGAEDVWVPTQCLYKIAGCLSNFVAFCQQPPFTFLLVNNKA